MGASPLAQNTTMAKSRRRKSNVAKQKRLIVERLESRTVLSASNLFATALELAPRLETRVELNVRPAFVASQTVAQDASVRAGLGSRLGLQLPIADRFAAVREPLAERAGDARGQGGRGGDILNWPSSPIGFTEARDISPQSVHLFLFGATDYSARTADDANWSAPINRRDDAEAESRFEWSQASPLRDLGQSFTGNSFDRVAFDFGIASPSFIATTQEPMSESFDHSVHNEAIRHVPSDRVQPSSLHTSNQGSTLTQPAGQFAAVSLAANDLAGQTDGGLIELPSTTPSDIVGLSVPRQFSSSAGNDAVEFFSLRRLNGGELQSIQNDPSLRTLTQSPDVSIADTLTTDNSPRSKAGQVDGGWVELNSNGLEPSIAIRRAPENSSWSGNFWLDAPRRVRDSFWLEFSETFGSRSEGDVAQQPEIETDESGDAGQLADSAALIESVREEGGMIELIAAAHSNITWPSSPSINHMDTPREVTDKVRMDTGVGLFQVFEIATSPQGMNKEGELSANQGAPFAEATTVIVTDAAPPSEQAAAMADKPEQNRSAPLPFPDCLRQPRYSSTAGRI